MKSIVDFRFLSLGGGVQSSTLALLIEAGRIPPVDAAIFADTQWEPFWVYDYLDWLESVVSFPVIRVTAGSLRDAVLFDNFNPIPTYRLSPTGSKEQGRRQCTSNYKLDPIVQAKRRFMGYQPHKKVKHSCSTLVGISIDEITRVKDSREKWNTNDYPLIDLGMSRNDCKTWLIENNYPIPRKSACIGCPYHGKAEWMEILDDPVLRSEALGIDALLNLRGEFLHDSRKPLSQVAFNQIEDTEAQSLLGNECLGLCGV